jgi:tryptophan synthase alpha chain
MTGVTGARQGLASGLEDYVTRVRAITSIPLCVGFGISTPQQASEVAQMADGVIIGSRIIQLMEEDLSLGALEDFTHEVRGAIDKTVTNKS